MFSTEIEFGQTAFTGEARWLLVHVRPGASTGGYMELLPRQPLTAAPYALNSLSIPGHVHSGDDIASGTVVDARIDPAIARDAEMAIGIADHAATSDTHHPPYSDGQAVAAVKTADGAGSGFDADLLDGLHATAFSGKPHNLIVVAKSGGDFTSIQTALDSIDDAATGNPYLVFIGPGVYNEQVNMKEWVDIQGSGEMMTKITSTGSAFLTSGTVVGASNAGLRFLTVENTGGALAAVAFFTSQALSRLSHVTANVTGGTYNYGAVVYYSSATLDDVTITATGASTNNGIVSLGSTSVLTNVTATASGGLDDKAFQNNSGSVATIRRSTFIGSEYSIENGSFSSAMVAASQLDGPRETGAGLTMVHCYDGSFAEIP